MALPLQGLDHRHDLPSWPAWAHWDGNQRVKPGGKWVQMGGGVVSLRSSGHEPAAGQGGGGTAPLAWGWSGGPAGSWRHARTAELVVRKESERLRAPRLGAAGPGTRVARSLLLALLAWG